MPVEVEKQTMEEFLGKLKPNGGMEECKHALRMHQVKINHLKIRLKRLILFPSCSVVLRLLLSRCLFMYISLPVGPHPPNG
jgi:hypothetical protein